MVCSPLVFLGYTGIAFAGSVALRRAVLGLDERQDLSPKAATYKNWN